MVNIPKPITVEEMYGDWDYEAAVAALERSLDPRRGVSIFDTVGSLGVASGDRVLDIGGRDGEHGLTMAERFGCHVTSVDPAPANVADGRKNLADHELGHMVDVVFGGIEAIPAEDDSFDLIFSRDMMGHVADQAAGLAECARVLKPGGAMVVYAVHGTELLEPTESKVVAGATATHLVNLDSAHFEASATGAGFVVEDLEVIGSEWYEANQEAGESPNYLLQISRLNRAKDELIAELGETAYWSMYGNALWGAFILMGKLEVRVYVLRLPE